MSRQGVPGITKSSTWWKNPKELNDDSEGSVDLPKIVQIEENVLDFQCYQHSFIKIKIIS